MITPMQMYWLTRLDSFVVMLACVFILLIVAVLVFGCVGAELRSKQREWRHDTDESVNAVRATGKRLHRYAIVLAVCAAVILVVGCFIPTTKEMAAIIIVPKIANSEKVQAAGNKLYDLAVEWMEGLKPNKKSEVAE